MPLERDSWFQHYAPAFAVGASAETHSVKQVKALIAAKDYEFAQVESAAIAHKDQLRAADAAWLTDWAALKARYTAARTKALDNDSGLIPDVLESAEDDWQAIIHALTKNPEAGYTSTDADGLYQRLVRVTRTAVDFRDMPQPPADVDLEVFKGADDLIRAGEQGAAQAARAASNAVGASPIPMLAAVVIGGGLLFLAIRR